MIKFSDLIMILLIGGVYWSSPDMLTALAHSYLLHGAVLLYLFFSIVDENREALPAKKLRQVLKVPYMVKYFCAIIRGKVYQLLNFPLTTNKGINVVFDKVSLLNGFDSYLSGADPWLIFTKKSKAIFIDLNSYSEQ